MGHQLTRSAPAAAVAAVLAAVAACGGAGDADPPPVLDNARDQIESATAATVEDSSAAGSDASSEVASTPEAPAELPPPDASTFEGSNRVVNLWVGPDAQGVTVDVWGRRTFTNGPLLLAEEIAFGQTSDYFSAPSGYSLVVVNAGAGPDGVERASLLNAAAGEQITTVYTNEDPDGSVSALNWFEHGSAQAPMPPSPSTGLVWIIAPNIRSFSDEMIEAIGGDAFYVGDGSEICREQRDEVAGGVPKILGGTQDVELELEPGSATISLHPWFSADECAQPSVLDLTIDVAAGATTMVVVFTPDGSKLDALTIPVQPLG